MAIVVSSSPKGKRKDIFHFLISVRYHLGRDTGLVHATGALGNNFCGEMKDSGQV